MVTTEAPASVSSADPDDDGPGWVSRWIRQDPVRAVAVALITIQVIWRANITSRSFHTQDEFSFASFATQSALTPGYLLTVFNDHLMPGIRLIAWLVTDAHGLAYWPYVLIVATAQALVSITFYRLLRQLLRPGWQMLVPLSIMLFSPLTLEANVLWVVGLFMLPMQLAMILAIGAQVKYIHTKRSRHLVPLALALLLGLAFTEKALLIAPLLLLLTACLFVRGDPLRSLGRATTRYWPAWLVVTLVSGAYLWLYALQPRGRLIMPNSVGEVVAFLRDLFGLTLGPGLVGGPWSWTPAGDGPPYVNASNTIAIWLAWAAILAFVVITIRIRPSAARAWTLLAGFSLFNAFLLAATRLGTPVSWLMGLVPRYVGEVVVVAALCAGVALLGLKHEAPARQLTLPLALRTPGAATAGLVAATVALGTLYVGTVWSTSQFADIAGNKHSRRYVETALAEFRDAPPGTIFIDHPVPEDVITGFYWPRNMQSQLFLPMANGPIFVKEAERPFVFDNDGHIRPAGVEGPRLQPGPISGCGYLVEGGKTVRMPLTGPTFVWGWAIRVAYTSNDESTATFRLGNATHRFPVHRGANQYIFHVEGGGDAVELTVTDPAVSLCTNDITVGKIVPMPPL